MGELSLKQQSSALAEDLKELLIEGARASEGALRDLMKRTDHVTVQLMDGNGESIHGRTMFPKAVQLAKKVVLEIELDSPQSSAALTTTERSAVKDGASEPKRGFRSASPMRIVGRPLSESLLDDRR